VATTDEGNDADRDEAGQTDVARYEQLRRRALDGDADGWRAGLAVLQHRGVAAWLRAWRTVSPTIVATVSPARPGPPPSAASRLVEALASMALGAVAAR